MLDNLLNRIIRRADERDRARDLYLAAVAQARQPGFYTACGVEDDLDGRFDMIVLHVFLTMRALRPAGEAGKRTSDFMFRIMMDDMDLNLREMGVSDLRVGKRVKAMAQAFYGRATAYDEALAADREADGKEGEGQAGKALKAALERNVYGVETPEDDALGKLAVYVEDAVAALGEWPAEALLAGRIDFPAAPQDSAG
jgi:cytochrome b pre-mRNA-processing protein 3